MKYFVCSDIHGEYIAFREGLNTAGYNKRDSNHRIICCGDFFGRASQAYDDCTDIYYYLTSPSHSNPPICIRGNHEEILTNIMDKGYISETDEYNGEGITIASFAADVVGVEQAAFMTGTQLIDAASKSPLYEWIESLPFYYETEHCIFTHADLPNNYEKADFEDWHYATWANLLNTFSIYAKIKPNAPYLENGKTLYCGHWHAAELRLLADSIYGRKSDIALDRIFEWKEIGVVALDCCTARSGKVEVVVVED